MSVYAQERGGNLRTAAMIASVRRFPPHCTGSSDAIQEFSALLKSRITIGLNFYIVQCIARNTDRDQIMSCEVKQTLLEINLTY